MGITDQHDGSTPYGFIWGPLSVERLSELPGGYKVLSIDTDFDRINVYVSKTGRKIRVFREGKTEELK